MCFKRGTVFVYRSLFTVAGFEKANKMNKDFHLPTDGRCLHSPLNLANG